MSEPNIYGVNITPDGTVAVFNGQQKYVDTIANFQTDFSTTVPAIPSGGNNEIYEQNMRHPIILSGNVIDSGPIPWTLADGWISNIATGLANQHTRQQTPPGTKPLGASDAQYQSQASSDDGGSSPRPGLREESGYTTVRGERVQPSGRKDGNPTKEEKEGPGGPTIRRRL